MRYLKGHLWLTVKAATGTVDHGAPRGGRGVLPNMGYIGMYAPKGYGFSAVSVINIVSILADFGHFGHK